MTTTPYWEDDPGNFPALPPGTAAVTPDKDPALTTAYVKGEDGFWARTGHECDTMSPDLPTLIVHIPKTTPPLITQHLKDKR